MRNNYGVVGSTNLRAARRGGFYYGRVHAWCVSWVSFCSIMRGEKTLINTVFSRLLPFRHESPVPNIITPWPQKLTEPGKKSPVPAWGREGLIFGQNFKDNTGRALYLRGALYLERGVTRSESRIRL